MNALDYEKALENASDVLDYDFIDSVIRASLNPASGKEIGLYNLIIVIEEAAELIEAAHDFSNTYSCNDHMHVLEEITDNLLSIRYAEIITGISDKDVALIREVITIDSVTLPHLNRTLAKWQQSVSKYIRRRSNIYAKKLTPKFMEQLTYDMAYLNICLHAYANTIQFSKQQINRAINVKINRQYQRNLESADTVTRDITIPESEMKLIHDLLSLTGDEIYDKYGYKKDETIIKTAEFEDDIEADIKLVICEGNEKPYIEGILFKKGRELTHTECMDKYDGEWRFEYENTFYVVNVTEEKSL